MAIAAIGLVAPPCGETHVRRHFPKQAGFGGRYFFNFCTEITEHIDD